MKTLFFLCFLFFYGCAGNEEKNEPKTFSDETNRAFEMIERGGSYYLKNPPAQSPPAPQIRRRAIKAVQVEKDDKINYNVEKLEPATRPATVEIKKQQMTSDERLIEINQNLAFYCMKHRKDSRYGGNETVCMKFVNKTMNECQKSHRIVNSKLLKCIQTNLRKK